MLKKWKEETILEAERTLEAEIQRGEWCETTLRRDEEAKESGEGFVAVAVEEDEEYAWGRMSPEEVSYEDDRIRLNAR